MDRRKSAAPILALLLGGCAAGTYVLARPSAAVLEEMGRRCSQDVGLRWFGPRPTGLEVWELGTLDHEPQPGASVAQAEPLRYGTNAADLLRSGLASTVYANVAGERSGVYRYELRPPSDPACAAVTAVAAVRASPDRRCMTSSYVGPFDGRRHPNMILDFDDAAAARDGFDRSGQVLFVDGAVRARSVRYAARKPGVSGEYSGTWGLKACEPVDKRSIYEALRGLDPY